MGKNKDVEIIQFVGTISTHRRTGERGLSGIYIILGEVEFEDEPCYVIRDFDGEGEESYIVPKAPIDNDYCNDVKRLGTVWIDEFGNKR